MSLFNFSEPELLTFFAILVRFSVLIAVLPFTGDKFIPMPAKILLSVAITVCMYPSLTKGGLVQTREALVWGATSSGIAQTIMLETLFGLAMGYVAKLMFDAITFSASLVGTFMGFAMATTYDANQETQTQVVSEFQLALATLAFLALDGHHWMLKSALDSYQTVGLGRAGIQNLTSQHLTQITGQVLSFGLQLAAPVAISIFGINIAFGVMSKAMPQLNVLVLSFAVTSIVGMVVMGLGVPEFQGAVGEVFHRGVEWMDSMKGALAQR